MHGQPHIRFESFLFTNLCAAYHCYVICTDYAAFIKLILDKAICRRRLYINAM